MSSCITRSEAIWISSDAKSRERLDDAVYSAIGNTQINSRKNLNGLPQTVSKMVVDHLEEYPCFGESEWTTLCERVDPVPPLPDGFSAIWNGPCPIFPEKKIRDTHMLVYIPATVDGEPLTLKKLGEIAKRFFPQGGYQFMPLDIVGQLGDKPIKKSHWVLMTKDVLPGSRDKSYNQQKEIVAELAKKSPGYEVPETIEAAVCFLAQYFNAKTSLFNDDPWTYTRCEEVVQGYEVFEDFFPLNGVYSPQLKTIFGAIVGGFYPSGFCVSRNNYNVKSDSFGVAALRKF